MIVRLHKARESVLSPAVLIEHKGAVTLAASPKAIRHFLMTPCCGEMMGVPTSLTVMIISACAHISEYIEFLLVSDTLMKLEGKEKQNKRNQQRAENEAQLLP